MIPNIPFGSKVIIGLGDSFTQGVGSWSLETWRKYKSIDALRIPPIIYKEMYQYSWVNQLCVNHMPEYIPINFGVMGTGNRAAVKELYLNPKVQFQNASEVIVILMLSGMERFDFVNGEFPEHNHFFTMWPNPWDKNTTNKKLWECYAESIWSDKFSCVETLLNIRDAEIFCKAHGYKFIVASAFDIRVTQDHFLKTMGDQHQDLINSIPWDNFIYPRGYRTFMELLTRLEGLDEHAAAGGFYEYCQKLKEPTDYMTPCAHPSQNGYRIMAEEIYKFITTKMS
jgi:hypothetical protein